MKPTIDHLVVVSPSLTTGIEYVSDLLGVTPEPGGTHDKMGTHNALLKLNEVYLEVIAIDPATTVGRKRWFELDALETTATPRLATWVVRTNEIHSHSECVPPGTVEAMSRGPFHWLFTMTPNGSLIMSGAFPALIQWLSDLHPADRMKETGSTLLGLEIRHPEAETLKNSLKLIGFESQLVQTHATAEPPTLRATIKTPTGIHELS